MPWRVRQWDRQPANTGAPSPHIPRARHRQRQLGTEKTGASVRQCRQIACQAERHVDPLQAVGLFTGLFVSPHGVGTGFKRRERRFPCRKRCSSVANCRNRWSKPAMSMLLSPLYSAALRSVAVCQPGPASRGHWRQAARSGRFATANQARPTSGGQHAPGRVCLQPCSRLGKFDASAVRREEHCRPGQWAAATRHSQSRASSRAVPTDPAVCHALAQVSTKFWGQCLILPQVFAR